MKKSTKKTRSWKKGRETTVEGTGGTVKGVTYRTAPKSSPKPKARPTRAKTKAKAKGSVKPKARPDSKPKAKASGPTSRPNNKPKAKPEKKRLLRSKGRIVTKKGLSDDAKARRGTGRTGSRSR